MLLSLRELSSGHGQGRVGTVFNLIDLWLVYILFAGLEAVRDHLTDREVKGTNQLQSGNTLPIMIEWDFLQKTYHHRRPRERLTSWFGSYAWPYEFFWNPVLSLRQHKNLITQSSHFGPLKTCRAISG